MGTRWGRKRSCSGCAYHWKRRVTGWLDSGVTQKPKELASTREGGETPTSWHCRLDLARRPRDNARVLASSTDAARTGENATHAERTERRAYLHVVVDGPAFLHSAHDGGEVVVRKDHVRRVLRSKQHKGKVLSITTITIVIITIILICHY